MNLGDPELELLDPTPNVHSLFVHFDKLFFTSTLSNRVVVRWSKRMYSCAGICSYEGRSGFCNIALSEPLLKLRPRKDLVETLLHEMIHAYLFVTNNDRDRDGHGPTFQAHMHRINRCAGLKISIYHNFVDEVKIYKTHVWRCNGPCQSRPPYFGIIRRSANRTPGPNDFWWSTHKVQCGGTFYKIKEPNKPIKNMPKSNVITNYIPSNKVKNKLPKRDAVTAKPVLKDSNRNKANVANGNGYFSPVLINHKPVSNVKGQIVGGYRVRSNSVDVAETVRNVWGKKQLLNAQGEAVMTSSPDLNPNRSKLDLRYIENTPANTKSIDSFFKSTNLGVLNNGSGYNNKINQNVPKAGVTTAMPTLKNPVEIVKSNRNIGVVINKDHNCPTTLTQKPVLNIQKQITSNRIRSNSADVAKTVRKVWDDKQVANAKNNVITNIPNINPNKHKLETNNSQHAPAKIKKIDDYFQSTASNVLKDVYGKDIKIVESSNGKKLVAVNDTNFVACPVCNTKVKNDDINTHLDRCLSKDVNNFNKDNASPASSQINERVIVKEVVRPIPRIPRYNGVTDFKLVNEEIKMMIPDSLDSSFVDQLFNKGSLKPQSCKPVKKSDIKSVDQEIDFNTGFIKIDKSSEIASAKRMDRLFSRINALPETQPGTSKNMMKDSTEICCWCNEKVGLISVEEHLNDCVAFEKVLTVCAADKEREVIANEAIIIDDDDDIFDESLTLNATGTKSPCPCCFKMIEQAEMNAHLDLCLT